MSPPGPGAAACCLLLAACRTALAPAELARVELATPPPAERLHLEVEIDGAELSGVFDAIVVARAAPPAVRLQLLPDLGPPVLDVVATPGAITGLLFGEAHPTTWRGETDDPPLAPALLFGITLLEQHAAAAGRLVRGYPGPPLTLALRGSFPGTTIEDARVESGRIVERTYRRGYVTWHDEVTAGRGTVRAPGFHLHARVLTREPAEDLDADVFVLQGPR